MLDLDTLDTRFSQIVKSADGKTSVAPQLASAYNDYAKGGTILGADCSSGGTVALLTQAFSTDGTPAAVANMASGICNFWMTVPKPGIPSHGGTTVVSVVPSFSTMIAAVTSAIQGCITTDAVQKPYKRLFQAVENVLKTAPCVVTEMIPGTPPVPTPFPEFLS